MEHGRGYMGVIDEVRFYNRAINIEEVRKLYLDKFN